MKAEACFRSAGALGYYSTMLRHFAHKVPFKEQDGFARFEFSCGLAELRISEGALLMHVTAETPEQLTETCDVVERHLLRFAFREAPGPLDWQVRP